MTITAILNIFNRVEYLEKQIKSLLAQKQPITEYIIRVNNTEKRSQYMDIINRLIPQAKVFESNTNLWVRSRFYCAFNSTSDYVFVLDDDVIPWSERCRKCLELSIQEKAIYWSWWSLFNSKENRFDRIVINETNNRPKITTQVDISWHSWFFHKSLLWYMFDVLPEYDCPRAWEELWISYRAWLYWYKTYIPSMNDDIETRGNKEPRLWIDWKANYNTHKDVYQKFYLYSIEHWFLPLQYQKWQTKN